jgi:hypothetical protein
MALIGRNPTGDDGNRAETLLDGLPSIRGMLKIVVRELRQWGLEGKETMHR